MTEDFDELLSVQELQFLFRILPRTYEGSVKVLNRPLAIEKLEYHNISDENG